MKKVFITAVAMQTGGFESPIYAATQENLANEQNEHYPIFNVMENAVNSTDEVEIIALKFPCVALERNYEILCDRVKKFEQKHNLVVKVTPIEHMLGETKEAHSFLFSKLIDTIEDCCEVYADITYGTKPTPMIIFALLRFLDSVRINTDIGQIVYGEIIWKRGPNNSSKIESAHIYDVTRLLRIITITESLSAFGGEDIEEAVKLLLGK